MKYRKKPVIIEAEQWLGWEHGPHNLGVEPLKLDTGTDKVCGWINTLEGGHIVSPGDYIITGVKGERYPCKPDIFVMTYDPVGGVTD